MRSQLRSGDCIISRCGRRWRMTREMSRRSSMLAGEPAVGVAEEDDVLDADLLGRGALLGLPDAADLAARHVGVEAAGVAVGADAVRHLDAGVGPGRDRAGGAEVEVVRVGDDDQRPLDRLPARPSLRLLRSSWGPHHHAGPAAAPGRSALADRSAPEAAARELVVVPGEAARTPACGAGGGPGAPAAYRRCVAADERWWSTGPGVPRTDPPPVLLGRTDLPPGYDHPHASEQARRIAERGTVLRAQVGSGVGPVRVLLLVVLGRSRRLSRGG